MLSLNRYGNSYTMGFQIDHYVNSGNLYVGLMVLEDGEFVPWSDLTVNLDAKCAENCAFIDTNDNGTDIIDWLVENNLGYPTDVFETSGFCVYPEFHFYMDAIKEHLIEE